jgi:hypothetical protein
MIKLTKILNEITVNKPKINIISKEEIKTALKHFDELGFDHIKDAMMAIIEDDDFEKRWDFGNHNNNSSDDAKYFNVIKRWRKQYIKEKGTNWKGLKEIQVNTPTPNINKIKDLIIKLVQNVDYLNMREIYNVLDHYGYGDLIFDDSELYNPDFTKVKNLSKLYNDLKQLQSKLNINEIKINKPDTIKSAEWEEAHRNLIYSFDIELSDIHGEGLFTNEPISKNRIFLTAGHPKDVYYNASYINHSSNPNSILVQSKDPLDGEIFYFVQAKRDIRPNEEITINYRTLPSNFDRNTTGFVNEIKVNQPIITPNTQLTQKIKDYIIDIIKSNISENINELIIDSYMSNYMSSNSNDVEDTIIDYVKHKMLSDEDIDMDSEEINSLDRDDIIEYINNNKSLQSYLCNIFWKYYIKYVNSILPKLIKDCLDNFEADGWEMDGGEMLPIMILKRLIGKVIDENDDYIIIDYPTEIIGRDDEFYQYLYNELIKDNNLNEIKVNQPQGKMFKLIKTHVPDQDRYVYDLAFIRPKPRNDINYLDNLLSQHYGIGASGYLLPNGDFELYFISKNYFNSLGINTYEKIGTITPHPVTVIPAKYINQSELAEIKVNQPGKKLKVKLFDTDNNRSRYRVIDLKDSERFVAISKYLEDKDENGNQLYHVPSGFIDKLPSFIQDNIIQIDAFKYLPEKYIQIVKNESLNEIKVNQPEKPRTLVGPYGEKTTNVSKFIKNMESHGHPLIKIYTADDEEVKSQNPIFDFSWMIGLPEFKGLNGPMGDPTTKEKIYYETWKQNRSMWEITVNNPVVKRHYIPKYVKHWINKDYG